MKYDRVVLEKYIIFYTKRESIYGVQTSVRLTFRKN